MSDKQRLDWIADHLDQLITSINGGMKITWYDQNGEHESTVSKISGDENLSAQFRRTIDLAINQENKP